MNPRSTPNSLTAALLLLLAGLCSAHAATPDQPWWPHPLWGSGDQAGASNWITPEKIKDAVTLVRTGKVYELGHIYEDGMPQIGRRSYKLVIPSFPTYGPELIAGKAVVFNDEFIAGELGQVGTQFDGPGHVGMVARHTDGSEKITFYNGFTADDLRAPYGLKKLGVEQVKPIVTRGVLIDVAGFRGEDTVPGGTAITLAEIRGALTRQGIDEASLRPGDALLFNFGWWRHWPKPITTQGPTPYIADEVVAWIIERQPSMVGSDANLDGPSASVHTEITLKNGIFNLELMTFEPLLADRAYEFLFIFTPLRLKGATGSPGRPIAIR